MRVAHSFAAPPARSSAYPLGSDEPLKSRSPHIARHVGLLYEVSIKYLSLASCIHLSCKISAMVSAIHLDQMGAACWLENHMCRKVSGLQIYFAVASSALMPNWSQILVAERLID